jgi:nucleotide-binding universal stress UspA family protein
MAASSQAGSALRHILLATDLSSISALAAQYATRLAEHTHAHFSVLHVFNPVRLPSSDAIGAHATPQDLRSRDGQRLEALIESIRTHVPDAEKQLIDGEPTSTVIDYAKCHSVDLIVTGTHGRRAFDRLLLGSTAEAIVRSSPCPVMTIGPNVTMHTENQAPFQRILCAMDFGEAAKSAAPAAIQLANQSRAKLRFLHVLPSGLYNGQPQPMIEQLFHNAMQHIISSNAPATEVECKVVYGSRISDTILADSLANRIDLIVLGVRRKGNLASRLPAGIAFQVIEGASCPVLTVSD